MNQKIYAHRGASDQAPENTLEAFDLAIQMGAHGVELDVHICRDGELVVSHDESIERVSNGTGFLCDLTLKELKSLSFNRTKPEYQGTRIPTLKEVFELLRPTGLGINIELKNSLIESPELERRVVEMTAREFSLDRVIFSSFNHYSMMRLKELDPSLSCGLLYEASLVSPWEYAGQLGMEALHPHYSQVITPGGFCESCHKAGIAVHTWTVNTKEEIRRVLKEGADILITNCPDVAVRLLQEEAFDPDRKEQEDRTC